MELVSDKTTINIEFHIEACEKCGRKEESLFEFYLTPFVLPVVNHALDVVGLEAIGSWGGAEQGTIRAYAIWKTVFDKLNSDARGYVAMIGDIRNAGFMYLEVLENLSELLEYCEKVPNGKVVYDIPMPSSSTTAVRV